MVDLPAATPLTGDARADGVALPRRRFGILTRMAVAFAVVAGMAVTSEMVAWLSLRHIESQLTVVVGHSVPAMTTAEMLAVEASAIANASGTLTAASTEPQRAEVMTTLAGRIAGLNGLLDELERLEVDTGILGVLRDRIATLAANLNRQSDLVAQRIALNTKLHDDVTELGDNHKQFLGAVTPRIDNTYRSLFTGIKTLVDDLGPTGAAGPAGSPNAGAGVAASYQDVVVLQRRIGHLFNHNVGEMLALLELAAAGNLAAGLLNEVILVTDPARIRQLRGRFGEITISMGTIRLNLATTPENQVLLGLTTPMLQYGLGAENLFDRRLRALDLNRASDLVVAENRRLSEALTTAVNRLLATARANAEETARNVQHDAAAARLLQTLAAALAVLVALGIGWRYVGRQIIGRILALQRAMEAEAAGREIVIPAHGDDEISDMATALGHFVSRRKLAESELRAAKERAEGAVRELTELQEALVQTEKMVALGGLVAGVAHELNTPVGVCLTAASLLTERTEDFARLFEAGQLRKSKVQDYVDAAGEISRLIRSNLERASDLVRVFKQVAIAPMEGERQIFRVREHIDVVIGLMAERLRTAGHRLTVDCPPALTMNGFPEALRQVVDVLLDNALTHGFPSGTTGAITITVAGVAPASVSLVVGDNGVGIQSEDRPHLFEPFFTTRRNQGGVGLGLHMVFNIVSSVLGGRIAVESGAGQGTRFIVTVPATAPAPAARRGVARPWTHERSRPIEETLG
jgi:signal transduction histidine kinase